MYGVPSDLPLQRLIGKEFCFIGLGRFQIQFHIAGTGGISVEGRWELRDAHGMLVDSNQEHVRRDAYRIHRIIDVPIANFRIDAPRSFTLFFEPGDSLTIYDDNDKYESFSINFEGMPGIYV